MSEHRPVAETLFDLLDTATVDIDDGTRIGPGEWDAYLMPGEAARMVVGGPGTGTTQFLCETVVRAVENGAQPERILALAFSRRGVEDLRSRLVGRLGPTGHRIVVTTSHSIAMRLVEQHAARLGWKQPPSLMTGVEHEALVARLLATEPPKAWPAPFRDLLPSEALASELTDFLLRSSEQMLTPDDIASFDRSDWRAIPEFLRRYDALVRSEGRLDYGLALVEALRLASIDAELLHTFDLVVADEYQDTAPAQAALLMACVGTKAGFVVAADPYQSIFSFRGADIANVYSFSRDVEASLGRPTERLVLDTSMRVPAEILAAAVAVTARELPGGAGKVRSTRTGGAVSCHEFATVGDEAEWIASDIERIHLLDHVPLERIAVFVRSEGPFLADLVRALERRGVRHTHSDARLVDEPSVRFVHDLVRAAIGSDDAFAAVRRVLLGPFVRAPQGMVSSLDDDPATWPSWIRRHLSHQAPIADLLEDASWCTESDAPSGLWQVWSTVPGLIEVAIEPRSERHRRTWSAYAQALERTSMRGGDHTLAEQVELAANVGFEADTLLEVDEGGVAIATLHQAKGTEFDVVFIADAVEGTLPDLRHRDSLLGVRHLNPHVPTSTADYVTFRLDEERRLAYTAMTRATSRVVWTATVPSEHGAGTGPSRFMRLVAATTPAREDREPLTPRALIAAVRRTVADPTTTPVSRLAGVSFLASGAGGWHDPLDAYGVRRHGPDHGVRPRDLRLSPSHANEYDTCPRRYAVERFLLFLDDDSPYMRIGNVIHTSLERADTTAVRAGRPRSSLDDAITALETLWPSSGFPDDHVGRAWYRRAERILEALYEGWPSAGEPVRLETALRATIEGVPWTGRADRIERLGSSLSIVDYKTSANAMAIDDAAVSLQLGFYVMAALDDPSIADLGEIEGASFWYPAAKPNRSTIATRHLDMARLDDVVVRLGEITRSILAEEFHPTPSRGCGRCTVRAICPAFPVGREAFA